MYGILFFYRGLPSNQGPFKLAIAFFKQHLKGGLMPVFQSFEWRFVGSSCLFLLSLFFSSYLSLPFFGTSQAFVEPLKAHSSSLSFFQLQYGVFMLHYSILWCTEERYAHKCFHNTSVYKAVASRFLFRQKCLV